MDRDLFEAIKSGARGYLLKNLEPEQLFETLEQTRKGDPALSPVMMARILEEFQYPSEPQVDQEELTERELEVLRGLEEGDRLVGGDGALLDPNAARAPRDGALGAAVRNLASEGATAVIAACTEVSLVFERHPPDLPWLDPLQILAEALVREAIGAEAETKE